MAKDTVFNLRTRKYETFKSNENFKKFTKIISSVIILFTISKIAPEIIEKMPIFFILLTQYLKVLIAYLLTQHLYQNGFKTKRKNIIKSKSNLA